MQDVVIVAATRTAVGSFQGSLAMFLLSSWEPPSFVSYWSRPGWMALRSMK